MFTENINVGLVSGGPDGRCYTTWGASKTDAHSQLPTLSPAKTKNIDFHCHPDPRA